ncbi:MAG: class I SAM-dependent methyltransferase [Micropruina sp.]
MDAEDARWLVSADAAAELARLADESDPSSLAAGERLRRRLPPGRAAAVSSQVALRRRAVAKFGDRAARLFFTPDGLEQASRPEVAGWRADRFAAAGVRRVVDLGCGIGTDALALVERGVPVDAVERDPVTAVLAAANLGDRGRVHAGTAEELWPALAGDGAGVFCDPARRTSSGRSWRVEDLSPSWEFVRELLAGDAPAAVKLGPGLAHRLIPDGVAATWVSPRRPGRTVAVVRGMGGRTAGRAAARWARAGRGRRGRRPRRGPGRTVRPRARPGGRPGRRRRCTGEAARCPSGRRRDRLPHLRRGPSDPVRDLLRGARRPGCR